MTKKFCLAVSVPFVFMISVLLISYSYKNWENPLIATGTVGAAIAAVWAIIYLEIIKPRLDRPKIEIREPGFNPKFYRYAPEKEKGKQIGIGYYINILLINSGERMAINCQPVLTGMWKFNNSKWIKELNWIAVPLRWAAGEDIVDLGPSQKIREERNLVPHRPYYFNLGNISTRYPQVFKILQIMKLNAQDDELSPGEYCFEVRVTGEQVDLPPRYFYVTWRGGCTDNLNEVEQRFIVSMKDNPPA
ncbi:MAG: hypothetical protein QME75_06405 [Deltaproteobacteria bacterium]|nr:hypothetical protein [Deltaproteobacteria bacterium]